MADSKQTGSLAEIGSTGLKRYGTYLQEEFLPELRGLRGIKVYNEMRNNDPTIGAMLRATTDAIKAVTWSMDVDEKNKEEVEAGEFIEQCMEDMSYAWDDFISEALTMLPFGWAFHEIVYKVRKGPDADPPSKYDDGKIGWRKVPLRGQETLFKWDMDENGGIQGMEQYDMTRGGPTVYIPIKKAVLFRTNREKNNPEGQSILRYCYRPWYQKKNLEEIEAIGVERDLTGLPVIYLPQGASAEDKTKAKDMVEKVKVDETSGLVLPHGPTPETSWKFELVSSPGTHSIDIDKVIQRYSGEIALAFLAQFLRLGQQRVGSYALSRDQKDFFYLSITAILDTIEETINRFMIPPLLRLNGYNLLKVRPKLIHGQVGQRDMQQFMQTLKLMAEAGLIGPVDEQLVRYVREQLGLPDLPEKPEEWENAPTGEPEVEPGAGGIPPGQPGAAPQEAQSPNEELDSWLKSVSAT